MSNSNLEGTRYVLIENCRQCRENQTTHEVDARNLQRHKWTAVIIAIVFLLLQLK